MRKPLRVLSVAVPPAGPDPPAPSVRPAQTFCHIHSGPPGELHVLVDFVLFSRCGRVSGEPLQSRWNLPGPGQRLQVQLSASVDRKDLPHRSVLTVVQIEVRSDLV